MTRDTWESDAGQDAIDRSRIRMANAAGLNANSNLAGGWVCQRALSEIKNAWARNFNSFVCRAHLCSKLVLAAATFRAVDNCLSLFRFYLVRSLPSHQSMTMVAYSSTVSTHAKRPGPLINATFFSKSITFSVSLALWSEQIDFYATDALD
jgi:hypothetical protein